jgi:DNA-binding beta-propeller fold protein YncE
MKPRRWIPAVVLLLVVPLLSASPPRTDAPPKFLTKWGSTGAAERQFDNPWGVALDAEGNVYVSDTENNRIQKFNRNGAFLRMWGWGVEDGGAFHQICTAGCQAGIQGNGNGQLNRPRGIGIDSSGNLYVANSSGHQVQKFSSDGAFIAKWGSLGDGKTGLESPTSIAVDSSDNVYVADTGNSRIKKYTSSGAFRTTWGWGVKDGTAELQICVHLHSSCQDGIVGTGDGQFNQPQGLAVDAFDNLYVVDTYNDRVQVFDDAIFLRKWGSTGSGSGEFNSPAGVAIDSAGSVYVACGNQDRVQKFDPYGTYLAEWGTQGTSDGQFYAAQGVAISAAGDIYVTDTVLDCVQRFAGPWLETIVAEAGPSGEHRDPTRTGGDYESR